MLYLAYGSNINLEQMKQRCPSAKVVGMRKIFGMKLVFNKIGVDGTAKANVINHDSLLYGVLYDISEKDLAVLDKFEGFPEHYKRYAITTTGGKETFFIYVAHRNMTSNHIRPSKEYKDIVVQGMHDAGFPEHYIKKVRNMKTQRRK